MNSSLVSYKTPRQIVLATLSVAAVVIAFWMLYRFRIVVFLVVAALFLNTAISPVVERLVSRGLSRTLSVALVYLGLIAFLVLVVSLVGPMLVTQVADFADRVPGYYADFHRTLLESPNYLLRQISLYLPAQLSLARSASPSTDPQSLELVAQFLTNASALARGLLIVASIFILAYYWNLENKRIALWLLLFVPAQRREGTRKLVEEIEGTVSAFLTGEVILGTIIGLASFGAYLLIGLPYAASLAVLAGLFELIPLVGPTLSAIVALLVALTFDPSKAIWVIVSAVVIQAFENYIIVPRVIRTSVGVNPLVTLLALAGFGSLFGIAGALLAIPMAAIAQILLDRLLLNLERNDENEVSSRSKLGLLQYEAHNLANDVRKTLRRKQAPSDDETDRVEETVEAMAGHIEQMLAQQNHRELLS